MSGIGSRGSKAWDHFEIKDPDKYLATCNLCHVVLSYKTTVSNLTKHLRTKHNFISDNKGDDDDSETDYDDKRFRGSKAWEYFEIIDPDKYLATCNLCHVVRSYKSTLSNLTKHLRAKHNDIPYNKGDDDDSETDCEEKKEKVFPIETQLFNSDTEKPKQFKSEVWEYFTIKDDEAKLATCNICKEQFSYKTTSANLEKHLRQSHAIDFGRNEEVLEVDGGEESEEETDVEKTEISESGDRRRSRKSLAWEYFNVHNSKRMKAMCKLCGALCSYRSSVSNLLKHVKRQHGEGGKGDEEATDAEEDTSATPTRILRAQRSVVWLYFKCVDPESRVSQCLLCKKLFSHSSTLTNLKKHLSRKHPDVTIPGRSDGSKRILLSSGGELYEIEAAVKDDNNMDDNQNETVEMDTVYLEDFDTLDEPKPKKRRLTKTAPRKNLVPAVYDTSSEEEVTLHKYSKKKSDSFDYFGRYVASLLRQLPKELSSQLQSDFVKQIMSTQLAFGTQQTLTDTQENAYSITITTDAKNVENEQSHIQS